MKFNGSFPWTRPSRPSALMDKALGLFAEEQKARHPGNGVLLASDHSAQPNQVLLQGQRQVCRDIPLLGRSFQIPFHPGRVQVIQLSFPYGDEPLFELNLLPLVAG